MRVDRQYAVQELSGVCYVEVELKLNAITTMPWRGRVGCIQVACAPVQWGKMSTPVSLAPAPV